MNIRLLFIDNGIYDAGIFEDYPAEGYHSDSDPPLPKVQLTSNTADPPSPKVQLASDTASTKGMWFESFIMNYICMIFRCAVY